MKYNKKLLQGKVAIVTGAARGIGRGIAIEMAKEGATVIVADLDKNTKLTSSFVSMPTDIRDSEQVTTLVNNVLRQFGKIDILVNNAGINAKDGGILYTDKENILDVLTSNLIGPFFLTQSVVKEMVSRKIPGSVLFTSSVHGRVAMLRPAYCISKAGLETLVKEAALELAKYGIRVNAVAPGAIAIRDENLRANAHVPLGYSGTPQDIANAMVFLASDKSSYITGQTIVVDGAFSIAHTRYWMDKGIL